MADSAWDEGTFDGEEGWWWHGRVFVPKNYDPSTYMLPIFLTPGAGKARVPVMARGKRGFTPAIQPVADVTEIEHDDPTPVTSSWVLVDPGDEETPPVIKEVKTVRKPQPGAPGLSKVLAADDVFGNPMDGQGLFYDPNAGGEGTPGLAWGTRSAATRWPTTIESTSGSGPRTLCSVTVPALPFAWRPTVSGQCIVSGTASTRPDLVARIGAVDGQIAGRGFPVPGVAVQRLELSSGPPAGSSPTYGVIGKNVGPTVIYLRAEEQASTVDAFTTSSTTTWFSVTPEEVA